MCIFAIPVKLMPICSGGSSNQFHGKHTLFSCLVHHNPRLYIILIIDSVLVHNGDQKNDFLGFTNVGLSHNLLWNPVI